MRSDTTQLGLYTHNDQALALAFRAAAEAARRNPFETPDQGEQRARFYEQEAARFESGSRKRA